MSSRLGLNATLRTRLINECRDKSDGCCVLCGMPIPPDDNTLTLEHFIPLFVFKWGSDENHPWQAVIDKIHSHANCGISHYACNYNRGVLGGDVRKLHITDKAKNDVNALKHELRYYISHAKHIMRVVRQKQNNRCLICNRELDYDVTLRRFDNSKPRCADNAACVHIHCCRQFDKEYRGGKRWFNPKEK